ncbi:hypothetical protein [Nocardioides sp. T2.26MG-1]|uniref:hypothetical protein n=1 Tax=Nocardioides sp. T2.26MG-1 TaxID=3041166 RepID=UPI0024778A9F|nr:hypothetical protein [Nocardioides sp. T2.26MG-1]CAI9419530.1 hypothetical protein HIDPHFAB_03738 [Nocardioides sp. T2.26MG-1]
MDKTSSGPALALTATLALYFLIMAAWVDDGTGTPADHAAAKVLGVVAGGLGIAVVFLSWRLIKELDARILPGYVPPDEDGTPS